MTLLTPSLPMHAHDDVPRQQQHHLPSAFSAVPTTVLRVSREVENIGERVPMSKKRVSWRFVLDGSEQVHTLALEHSLITAKKRLRLDGRRLFHSEQYCAGDWTYAFRVDDHEPLFTVAIKDVKTTVVDQHSLAGIYELYVEGHAWEQLSERVFAGVPKRKISNPVWSSDKFARRVSDETFDLQHNSQQPGTGRAWVFAFGVLGTIHKLELWDLEQGEFVVVLDCRELARVSHDGIDGETWEFEYTLANQHELVVTVTLEGDGERRADLAIDGSPWKDMSETDFVLQPGWFPVFSRSKGTAYFRSLDTTETKWEKPIMSRNGSTIIEQIPSQDLLQPVVHGYQDHHRDSTAALRPQPTVQVVAAQPPLHDEVNLLDFSEISVHSSPTHAQHQLDSSNYASFDPFEPVHQQQQAPPPPAAAAAQRQQQALIDFLS
ncbi:hypothetical protein PybrP1_010888 [[Pythium] brassicae (nom. inval.)]|nr:hypothetical protein PybrP1_010888 [[Pythium] brassicae (nom. inval.)]